MHRHFGLCDAVQGPMDQVQINVVCLQFLKGESQRGLRITVVIVPEFGRNKEIFTFDQALLYSPTSSFTDELFILVSRGGVKVSIPHLNRCVEYLRIKDA